MWGRRRIMLVAAAALAIIMLHPVITVDRDTHNKQRCDQDDIFEWEPGETIENCKIRDVTYTKQEIDVKFGIFRLEYPAGGPGNDGTPGAADGCLQKYGVSKIDDCPDTKSPVITVPDDITAEQNSSRGVYVSVSATAVDDVDGNVPVSCDRESGWFTLGKTSIVCSTVDNAGNRGYAMFTVTITNATSNTNSSD